jgi:hypothetical protein
LLYRTEYLGQILPSVRTAQRDESGHWDLDVSLLSPTALTDELENPACGADVF